jgi:hypothetical protein
MAKSRQFGGAPPRYTLLTNAHPHERVSKCPMCRKQTFQRKFPLVIHIDDLGLLSLGKTGPYCAKCEVIVVHLHELEAQLAHAVGLQKPEAVCKEYLILGTQDRKSWKSGLVEPKSIDETMPYVSEFKKVLELHVEPGGWFRND